MIRLDWLAYLCVRAAIDKHLPPVAFKIAHHYPYSKTPISYLFSKQFNTSQYFIDMRNKFDSQVADLPHALRLGTLLKQLLQCSMAV
jgi:hypothetical protein